VSNILDYQHAMKDYHIPDLRIRIMHHGVLEGSQEILLELEMGQLFLFEEPHSKLSQGVEGKESHMGVTMAADLRHSWHWRLTTSRDKLA